MRAVTFENGGLVVADGLPEPRPGAGEILVRVRASGLNGADRPERRTGYDTGASSGPVIPGLEFAGEVAAAGLGTTRFAIGARVMAIVAGGGQAEFCVVHERQAMLVPDTLDWPAAGGVPEVFTTAHDALFTQAALRLGERLLVHAAAGGVGTAAVQLGVAAGAHVTAAVRSPAVRDAVRALGAHEIIAGDRFADHGPFDVILELVGAPNLSADIDALAVGGRIVVIGVPAGDEATIRLRALMAKRGTLRASRLRARPLEEKAATARAMERHVLPHLSDGTISVPVLATYDLADAARAYERFAEPGKFGKIVLTMGE